MDTGRLMEEVKKAMCHRELKVYYQPQYDSFSYQLKGAEALVRWIREDGTVVMPGEFLPQLEQTEVICELDWYVLEEACRFLAAQKQAGIPQVPISLNFSRKHVNETGFGKKLTGIVDRYEIGHELIQAEITETAYVEQPERVLAWADEIRGQNFRIAVDDFGSDLSSVSFFMNIHADILKIDKGLLEKNCEDEKERIILESIFDVAHRLKMRTVAEGVETKEQLQFLRTCDCNLIQGFYFAKPMPEEEFRKVCQKGASEEETEDILISQTPGSARNLLLEAVFMHYPLVIFANLTRNSYYMMAYENFSATSCPSTGVFEELIEHGTQTMHPQDRALFHDTFQIGNLMERYRRGEKSVTVITRQIGDDGICREVETTDYFVKNPSAEDVLVITLCHNLREVHEPA